MELLHRVLHLSDDRPLPTSNLGPGKLPSDPRFGNPGCSNQTAAADDPYYLLQGLSHADGAAPAPAPTPSGASSVRSAFQQTNNLTGSIPHILSNQNDMQVHILPIGATIQRVIVPNAEGIAEDVVLGYDDPTQYQVASDMPLYVLLEFSVYLSYASPALLKCR